MKPNHPRAGWEEAFAEMAARGDDQLIDETQPTKWDESEWEWRRQDDPTAP